MNKHSIKTAIVAVILGSMMIGLITPAVVGKNKESPDEFLKTSSDLGNQLETHLKQKIDEYFKDRPGEDRIKELERELQENFERQKARKEDDFVSRYQETLDDIIKLKNTKFNLNENKQKIEGIINQILNLNKQINNQKNVLEISEQLFKQRLASVPNYFLLLGKKLKGRESRKDAKEAITNGMQEYLRGKWVIFEFKSETSVDGVVKGQVIKKDTIYPDDREYDFKKKDDKNQDIICVYQVYRHYPFYIYENEELGGVYKKLIEVKNFKGDILDFKLGNERVGERDTRYIDFSSIDIAKNEMIQFFGSPSNDFEKTHKKFENILKGLKKNNEESLKQIGEITEKYIKERSTLLYSLEEIEQKKARQIQTLKNFDGLNQNINVLAEMLKKKTYQRGHQNEKTGFQEVNRNLSTEVENLVKYLEIQKNVSLNQNKIAGFIKTLIATIDQISGTANDELKRLTISREFEYLEVGRTVEDEKLGEEENFRKAAFNAFEVLKNRKMSSWADIIEIDEYDTLTRISTTTAQITGEITTFQIPLIYKKELPVDKKLDEHVVYLNATVVFNIQLEGTPGEMKPPLPPPVQEKDYEVRIPSSPLIWTRDEDKFVVYEDTDSSQSMISLLNEKQKHNQNWRVPTREDYESLQHNRGVFENANFQLNRNYWSSDKTGGYYVTYKFVKKTDTKISLESELRDSKDGAYCVFVRR